MDLGKIHSHAERPRFDVCCLCEEGEEVNRKQKGPIGTDRRVCGTRIINTFCTTRLVCEVNKERTWEQFMVFTSNM